jgi:hypothetical protein
MKTNQITQITRDNRVKTPEKWAKLGVLLAFVLLAVSARASDIYWGLTNSGAGGNWSAGTSWVGGNAPLSSDNALISSTNGGFNITNAVDNVVAGLTYTFSTNINPAVDTTAILTRINPGTKLSVLGPQGFVITRDVGIKFSSIHNFTGDTLVVSNLAARFVLNSGQAPNNSSKSGTINLSGLTNLNVTVDLFGAANGMLAGGAAVGDQQVKVTLARTNVVFAGHKDDYTQIDFTNSIEFARMDFSGVATAFAANSFYQLGFSNLFLADSIGLGRGYALAASSMALSSFSSVAVAANLGFQVSFANLGTSSAYFRNTNGTDRVSLLALGVDSGTNAATTGNRQGAVLNLQGGKVDMLVDQVWLCRNATNTTITSANGKRAGFAFDNGIVDANTVIAGYMQYTNTSLCQGYLVVGSNAVMRVNNTLILGYTPTNDPTGAFISAENNTGGQVQINSGGGTNGTLYVNKIEVGLASTNNQVVVNGVLVVSNAIASSAKALNVLNVGATGQLKFKITPGVTNAFAASLVNADGAKIGITEAPSGGQASYVVIRYSGTPPANSFSVGDLPANIKGAAISDDGANIIITLSTNAPKSLVWRGLENSNWDHTSTNWFNPAGGTNCAFGDSDKVQFDDQSGVPTTISITEAVYPSQTGFGIVMTNSVNAFVFSSGGGSIQNASIAKAGTSSLQIDVPTTAGATIQQGSLTGSGTLNSVLVATNASMNFGGTISGVLAVSGNATLASGGIVNGSVSVATSATFTNSGTVNGAFSMSDGSTVNNNTTGLMTAISSTTVRTNAVFNNSGMIFGASSGSTLTVDLGGTLVDNVNGTPGAAPGSINIGSVIVNGLFQPGGSSIKTTKITDYKSDGVNVWGNPSGRLNLNLGSTTIIRVNVDGAPTNTVILTQNQGFGGSLGFKSFTGGTLVISNTGSSSFAAGQSFKVFGYYYDNAETLNAGLNTTNTYPIMSPATPGSGLAWDLSQLIPQGYIKVLSVTDPSRIFSLTNSSYLVNDNGTNKIVTQLLLPVDQPNGWVQILNTSLTNGLSATNWLNVTLSTLTNMPPNTYIVTNNVTGNSATFYRFVTP